MHVPFLCNAPNGDAEPALGERMSLRSLLDPILGTEHLTRGLGDAEARLLVEWLVDQAEAGHVANPDEAASERRVGQLCRRARAVARFVCLWCHEGQRGAAIQLAATERFPWPLPTGALDPWELLQDILEWESERIANCRLQIESNLPWPALSMERR